VHPVEGGLQTDRLSGPAPGVVAGLELGPVEVGLGLEVLVDGQVVLDRAGRRLLDEAAVLGGPQVTVSDFRLSSPTS
jgi:hypothetical protein